MKPIFILALTLYLAFQYSCQHPHGQIDIEVVGITEHMSFHESMKNESALVVHRLQNFAAERVKIDFESELLSHGRFIFLDDVDLSQKQIESFKEITENYELDSDVTKIYDLEEHWLALKYDNAVNKKLTIYNHDRKTYAVRTKKIVLVVDQGYESPYLAALVDLPNEANIYYAWSSTNYRKNPYPFIKIEDEITNNLAQEELDSLNEYQIVKEKFNQLKNDYDAIEVKVFEVKTNEKYVVVQHNWYGQCESLNYNYSAVYHVNPSGWALEAEGSLDKFCFDLVDVDFDGYPELLLTDFSSSAIYEMYKGSFKKKKELSWSFRGCQC